MERTGGIQAPEGRVCGFAPTQKQGEVWSHIYEIPNAHYDGHLFFVGGYQRGLYPIAHNSEEDRRPFRSAGRSERFLLACFPPCNEAKGRIQDLDKYGYRVQHHKKNVTPRQPSNRYDKRRIPLWTAHSVHQDCRKTRSLTIKQLTLCQKGINSKGDVMKNGGGSTIGKNCPIWTYLMHVDLLLIN